MTRKSVKPPLSGVVLAGGRAGRLSGRDKTKLRFGRQTLLERTLGILDPLCDEKLISSNSIDNYPGCRVVPDLIEGQGPLGALHSCLLAARHPNLIIVATDMPFISTRALAKLWQEREEFDVVIPRSPDGMQPLAALYSKSCLTAIDRQLQKKNFKIRSFFPEVRVKVVNCLDFPEIYHKHIFLNINSPDDLEKALALYTQTN